MPSTFKRTTGTDDPKVQALEDSSAQASRDATVSQAQGTADFLKSGKLLSKISIVLNTAKTIPHGLGKVPTGCFPVNISGGNPTSWVIKSMDASNVVFEANHTCSVSLWVWS